MKQAFDAVCPMHTFYNSVNCFARPVHFGTPLTGTSGNWSGAQEDLLELMEYWQKHTFLRH